MPLFVFVAFAIFSVPGGLLSAWIGKKKVFSLGLGVTTHGEGVPVLINPTPHRRSLFWPRNVCHS